MPRPADRPLQVMERVEEPRNGPDDSGSRARSSRGGGRLDPALARDALALVDEDHRVTVEGDAQLVVPVRRRLWPAGCVAAATRSQAPRAPSPGVADRNSCAPKGRI